MSLKKSCCNSYALISRRPPSRDPACSILGSSLALFGQTISVAKASRQDITCPLRSAVYNCLVAVRGLSDAVQKNAAFNWGGLVEPSDLGIDFVLNQMRGDSQLDLPASSL
ncbi:hypothetical protein TgHK011_009290 [Trichoderma gracile]|nr:hypothetical protein TgHK011_009290 [Trichoderma gracile]